MSKPDCQWIFR